MGQREEAESAYRRAVELAPKDASRVEPYVALSMLLNQLGKLTEAQALLDHARAELPDSSAIHRAIGDVASAQGRYDDAIAEYNLALKLDAGDLRALFQLGVTLRRAKRLDEAQAAFDRVATVDKEYPGLALERGLLYEVAGRADEALKAYEAALAKAPDDFDLMLRVGCSNASAAPSSTASRARTTRSSAKTAASRASPICFPATASPSRSSWSRPTSRPRAAPSKASSRTKESRGSRSGIA
jgi:tetratricopeptide (TPR) repeat protein